MSHGVNVGGDVSRCQCWCLTGLLVKGVSQTIKNEAKQQEEGLFSVLLGTLGTSLLGNLLTEGTIRAGEGTFRAT